MKLLDLVAQGTTYVDKLTKILNTQGSSTPNIEVIFVLGEMCIRDRYVEVTAREDTPFLPAGQSIRAHEFHYWDTNDNGDMFQAVKASGKGHWPCMRQEQQILAGFPHLYYGSNPELAGNFVKGCFQWQERCAGKQVAECHRKMLTGMVGCVGAMVLEGQADESLEGQRTKR